MTEFEWLSVILGVSAMIISIIAIGISRTANDQSQSANNLSQNANELASGANELARQAIASAERMAQQSNYLAWVAHVKDLPGINPASLIGPDVQQMANGLNIISTAWQNESIDRATIFQNVGDLYIRNYDIFFGNQNLIPGYENLTLASCITPLITQTYKEMKAYQPTP